MTEKRKKPALSAKQKAFLAAFRVSGNISVAARSAEVARHLHYHWLTHQEYADAFAEAQEEASDLLEEEARRRAVRGVNRLKFYNGQPIMDPVTGDPYVEMEYSDTLLIFLLKAARPEKFRENRHVEVNSKVDHKVEGNVSHDVTDLDSLDLPVDVRRQIVEAYQKKKREAKRE